METPSQIRLDKIYHPIPICAKAAKGNETQVGVQEGAERRSLAKDSDCKISEGNVLLLRQSREGRQD